MVKGEAEDLGLSDAMERAEMLMEENGGVTSFCTAAE